MGFATVLGNIAQLNGTVVAETPDGAIRYLVLGDILLEGETLHLSEGTRLVVQLEDGTLKVFHGEADLLLSISSLRDLPTLQVESAEADQDSAEAEGDEVAEQDFDPNALEPTASGPEADENINLDDPFIVLRKGNIAGAVQILFLSEDDFEDDDLLLTLSSLSREGEGLDEARLAELAFFLHLIAFQLDNFVGSGSNDDSPDFDSNFSIRLSLFVRQQDGSFSNALDIRIFGSFDTGGPIVNLGFDFIINQAGFDSSQIESLFQSRAFLEELAYFVQLGSNAQVYIGTDQDETISGTEDGDILFGLEGHDELLGGGGDDRAEGGAGDDRIIGGSGDDYLQGDEGDDWIEGGSGDDRIRGGVGADTLFGDAGNDFIVVFDTNADEIYGGDGRDTISGIAGKFYGGAGNDEVYGGQLAAIYGGAGNDRLESTGFAFGGDGNDQIVGGGLIAGGFGSDTIVAVFSSVLYGDEASPTSSSVDFFSDADTIHGSAMNDIIYGGNEREFEDPYGFGYQHGDSILAGAGHDIVYGGTGSDFIRGDEGDDLLHGQAGDDTLSGGAGNDRLIGGTGRNFFEGGTGRDLFVLRYDPVGDSENSGEADVVLDYQRGTDRIIIEIDPAGGADPESVMASATISPTNWGAWLFLPGHTVAIEGDVTDFNLGDIEFRVLSEQGLSLQGSGILLGTQYADDISGGAGDDLLYGADGDDTLSGGDGHDILRGEAGADRLIGGRGNDLFHVQGDDRMRGGEGADRFRFEFNLVALASGLASQSVAAEQVIEDFALGEDVLDFQFLVGTTIDQDTLVSAIEASLISVQVTGAGTELSVRHADPTGGGEATSVILLADVDLSNGGALDQVGMIGSLVAAGSLQYAFQNQSFAVVDAVLIPSLSAALGIVDDSADGLPLLVGTAGDDRMSGSGQDARFEAGAGDDFVLGGQGNEEILGDEGRDRLYGSLGHDAIFGGSGNDWIFGGTGSDIIFGESGDDLLVGGNGNDRLSGGDGNDWLQGASGFDILIGGGGRDVFFMDDNSQADTTNVIKDFEVASEGNPGDLLWFANDDASWRRFLNRDIENDAQVLANNVRLEFVDGSTLIKAPGRGLKSDTLLEGFDLRDFGETRYEQFYSLLESNNLFWADRDIQHHAFGTQTIDLVDGRTDATWLYWDLNLTKNITLNNFEMPNEDGYGADRFAIAPGRAHPELSNFFALLDNDVPGVLFSNYFNFYQDGDDAILDVGYHEGAYAIDIRDLIVSVSDVERFNFGFVQQGDFTTKPPASALVSGELRIGDVIDTEEELAILLDDLGRTMDSDDELTLYLKDVVAGDESGILPEYLAQTQDNPFTTNMHVRLTGVDITTLGSDDQEIWQSIITYNIS